MVILSKVDRFVAEQEIRNLSYRYARGADRLDAELFASAFWADGAFNEATDTPFSIFAGQLVEIMDRHFAVTHHLNGNTIVDFKDEHHASSETYFRAYHLTKPGLTIEEASFMIGDRRLAELSHKEGDTYEIIVSGRYLDDVEKREGVWKIKIRRLIFDCCSAVKSQALSPGEGMSSQGAATMRRDKRDLSYSILPTGGLIP